MCEPPNRDNGASDLWTLTAYNALLALNWRYVHFGNASRLWLWWWVLLGPLAPYPLISFNPSLRDKIAIINRNQINNIVQHLVSLLCTSLWELNVQRIVTIAQSCSYVPFHRSAWCHNNDFALCISVDLRDLINTNILWMKYMLRVGRALATFTQEEEKVWNLTHPWYSGTSL